MRVEILKRGSAPLVIQDFDQLVVKTEGGAPVAIATRYGPNGTYLVSSIDDDKRFQEILHKLGIHKALVISNLSDIMTPDSELPTL